MGKFITPALLQPHLYDSKKFIYATAFYTAIEMAGTRTKVTGTEVKFQTTGGSTVFSLLSEKQKHELK